MLKKILAISCLVFALSWALVLPQSAAAKGAYRAIPRTYRGTWIRRSPKFGGHPRLTVRAHAIHATVLRLKGHRLGVHVGHGYVTVFQAHKGHAVGENYILRRTCYHHRVALKVSYDTRVEFYTRA